MFEMFFPDEYVVSTYVIPFEKLYEEVNSEKILSKNKND